MTENTLPNLHDLHRREPQNQFLGRVIIVDDDETIRDLLSISIEKAGFIVKAVATTKELKEALSQRFYDAVLLDFFLEGEEGIDVLPHIIREYPYTKVFMMSVKGSVELAATAMESGASFFISKAKNAKEIVQELVARLGVDKRDPFFTESPDFYKEKYGIVGNSPQVANLIQRIELVKNVDSTVLIYGESGTGKELVARAIHKASPRATQRFEALNCGAIPANLLESEFFGHRRGAFTDAKVDRKGIFEICSEGSLLLDEIGELPHELQVKLLRVLQEGEITPLGSNKSIKVNTRVIAATNKNLEEEVRKGNFREDLYFRLAVLTIDLPPLRERRSDIPMLVQFFSQKICEKFAKQMHPLSKDLEARLIAYDWPGNIRELQNAIERGVVLSVDGDFHIEDMLPLTKLSAVPGTTHETLANSELITKTLSEAKLEFEKEYLKQLLEKTGGNISQIARISGRYRADVYRLLAKHDVEWQDFRQ